MNTVRRYHRKGSLESRENFEISKCRNLLIITDFVGSGEDKLAGLMIS